MIQSAAVQFYLNAKDGVSSVLRVVRGRFADLKANITDAFSPLTRLGLGIGAGAVGSYLSSVNQEIQDFRAQLRVLLGDAQKADIALEGLAEFELKTPFEYRESIEAFILLRKMGISPTMEALTELGNVAAQQGKSINYVAEAIKSASIGMANPLEAATGAIVQYDAGGKKLRITYQGVTTTIDRNVASIGEWVRSIGRMPSVAGAAEARMKTLGGAMSNMRGAVYRLAVAIGDAGFSKDLGSLANRIGDVANAIRTNGSQINWWYRIISLGFKQVIRSVTAAFKVMWNLGLAIGFSLKKTFTDLAKTFLLPFAGLEAVVQAVNKRLGTNFQTGLTGLATMYDNLDRSSADSAENISGALQGISDALEPVTENTYDLFKALSEGPQSTAGLDYTVDAFNQIATVTQTAAQAEQERAAAYAKTLDAVKVLRKYEIESGQRVLSMAQREMLAREAVRAQMRFNSATTPEARAEALGPMQELNKLVFAPDEMERMNKAIESALNDPKTGIEAATNRAIAEMDRGIIARALALTPEDMEFIRGTMDLLPNATDSIFERITKQGRLSARSIAAEFDQSFEQVTRDVLGGFTDGVVNSFQLWVQGSKQAGLAFRQAFYGAIADVAAQEAKFHLAKAVGATAEGLLMLAKGNPGAGAAFASAGKHLAAAAAFGALAGGAGAAAGGLIGGSRGPASDFARDAQTLSRGELGTTTIVLQGDPVYDFTNPRRLDEFAKMLETIGGRRIVIRNARG